MNINKYIVNLCLINVPHQILHARSQFADVHVLLKISKLPVHDAAIIAIPSLLQQLYSCCCCHVPGDVWRQLSSHFLNDADATKVADVFLHEKWQVTLKTR